MLADFITIRAPHFITMGKAPLILQYLHDHARLICDKRNETDGTGTWRITPIPDEQRRNIIFHYGSTENFQEFFNNIKPQKESEKVESPTMNYCEINLKSLERREMMRMTEKKFTKQQSRLTLKRNPHGIFSNGIQSNRILIPKEECNSSINSPIDSHTNHHENVIVEISPMKNPTPSTSSIYLASQCPSSSDYERNMFQEPDDFESAHLYHEMDLNGTNNWFDDTVNYTQSQRQSGFVQRHADYYRFNSQI